MERDGDHDSARRQRRLPLRARSMVAFGATALILSSSLAAINYLVTRSALIDQRQATAERQAFLNARAVRGGMEAGDDDPQSVLTVVQASSGGAALLLVGSDGYSTSVAVGRRHVPESLRDMVEDGRIGRQRVMLAGEPVVAVGVPLPAVDATYVEFVPMSEIEGTLDRVRVGLVAAAMVMTLVGVLAGRVASDRVLHPVRRMSRAARSIGEGALDRRLDSEGDADLEPLVESFNDMVDGLQSRIEREARFASDVSHELRSPLATIDAALSVARRRATEAQSVEALDVLGAEVDRFRVLVTDLLEISRAEAGIAELHLEPVDPVALVKAVVESTNRDLTVASRVEDVAPAGKVGAGPLLGSIARPPSQRDRPVDSDDVVRVEVDRRRFGQALINILDNADNYAGGATSITVATTPDTVRFEIDDDGPGIPEHERFHVFERFARGSTSEAPDAGPGTGLGLSLVAEHVRLHKGTIAIDDAPGGGARFVIELPRIKS